MKLLRQLLVPFYSLILIGLFLYSYTQVDLSLTLSRMSLWQVIEKSFQYVGYFQRPLSTGLYVLLLILLFIAYWLLLLAVKKKKLSRNIVWKLILFSALLLTFSYNAFSYDLFNYIFDAKIITHYFQNPYVHMAVDFPKDPMLSFMHWTGRTYPYGPIWLAVTVPLSFIGLQVFLPTFFLFKALAAAAYIGTAYCIEKILLTKDKENSLFGLAVFAFSPIVIIEGLVSAHNDMVMVFFAAFAILLLVYKNYVRSLASLLLSIGIKFATAMLLPLWIGSLFVKKNEKHWQILMIISFVLMIVPVVFASFRTNFQPWYILFLFPFVALFPKRPEIIMGYTVFSFAALLQYVPFLYTGAWDPPIPFILTVITWIGIAVSLITMFLTILIKQLVVKRS